MKVQPFEPGLEASPVSVDSEGKVFGQLENGSQEAGSADDGDPGQKPTEKTDGAAGTELIVVRAKQRRCGKQRCCLCTFVIVLLLVGMILMRRAASGDEEEGADGGLVIATNSSFDSGGQVRSWPRSPSHPRHAPTLRHQR